MWCNRLLVHPVNNQNFLPKTHRRQNSNQPQPPRQESPEVPHFFTRVPLRCICHYFFIALKALTSLTAFRRSAGRIKTRWTAASVIHTACALTSSKNTAKKAQILSVCHVTTTPIKYSWDCLLVHTTVRWQCLSRKIRPGYPNKYLWGLPAPSTFYRHPNTPPRSYLWRCCDAI